MINVLVIYWFTVLLLYPFASSFAYHRLFTGLCEGQQRSSNWWKRLWIGKGLF